MPRGVWRVRGLRYCSYETSKLQHLIISAGQQDAGAPVSLLPVVKPTNRARSPHYPECNPHHAKPGSMVGFFCNGVLPRGTSCWPRRELWLRCSTTLSFRPRPAPKLRRGLSFDGCPIDVWAVNHFQWLAPNAPQSKTGAPGRALYPMGYSRTGRRRS